MVLIPLLIIFIFGQLLRVNVLPDVTIHLNDVIVGLIALWGIKRFPRPIVLWAIAMALSLLVNLWHYAPKEILVSSFYAIRWLAYAGLFFALADFKDRVFLQKGLIIVALMIA